MWFVDSEDLQYPEFGTFAEAEFFCETLGILEDRIRRAYRPCPCCVQHG